MKIREMVFRRIHARPVVLTYNVRQGSNLLTEMQTTINVLLHSIEWVAGYRNTALVGVLSACIFLIFHFAINFKVEPDRIIIKLFFVFPIKDVRFSEIESIKVLGPIHSALGALTYGLSPLSQSILIVGRRATFGKIVLRLTNRRLFLQSLPKSVTVLSARGMGDTNQEGF